jgi:hypothetical protein
MSGFKILREVEGKRVPMALGPEDCPPLETLVDAMLYIGPTNTTVEALPELYRDEAYVAELRRRAAVLLPISGDHNPEIDELVKPSKTQGSRP